MKPNVTICIPAYRSASFINRTLDCARAQTYRAIRIVVSVDLCDDGTVEICRRHAREDERITLLIQNDRLGWSGNANAALDSVDTEFGCLYFHDDIIEPTYVARLLNALAARSDAASAHCDLVEFGLVEEVKPAHTYDGAPMRRLIDFMMTQRGTTLRSMLRMNGAAGKVRFPRVHGDNHWAAYVFHLRLLAAGAAMAVHEPLYRRWQREGSMTRSAGWQPDDLNAMLLGQRQAAELCLKVIDEVARSAEELDAGRYCFYLFQSLFTRRQQRRMQDFALLEDADILLSSPADFATRFPEMFDPEVVEWVTGAERQLVMLERKLNQARQASRSA